jgi:threonine dehydrogenase-like Zn-dependent dehydrogenase
MIADMGYRVRASVADVSEEPAAVIATAGTPEVLPWALHALAPHGVLVVAAYGPVDGLDMTPVSRKELAIRGMRSGRVEDLQLVMQMAAALEIRLPPISRWPLERSTMPSRRFTPRRCLARL